MKIQTLFHRTERPLRVALAMLSTAFALTLLAAASFEPARSETGMQAHRRPTVAHAVAHHMQPWIVSGLAQIIGRAI
jgi:hypothetical protein